MQRLQNSDETQWDENKVDAREASVWLQGCNEGTHGVRFCRVLHMYDANKFTVE
jgi:hypothetical protein